MVNPVCTDLDGSNDVVVIQGIFYEREDISQYIADLAMDHVNGDFVVIGYLANSGGRSIYRVPMPSDSESHSACLWGFGSTCDYLARGEELLVGNCDAAAYSESVKGGGMSYNCRAGWVTRYPAAGSGDVVVVPALASSGLGSASSACAAITQPSRGADQCGALAVPTPEPDRRVFYGFDHDLGWLDRGAGEIRELRGPGLTTRCGAQQCYPYNASEVSYHHNVAYSSIYSIAGPVLDRVRHYVYYIWCSSGYCAVRDAATGECIDMTEQVCGMYTLSRYNWLTGVTEAVWTANVHDFPGPNVFSQHLLKIAVDANTETVYWATRYQNHDGTLLIARVQLQGRDLVANPLSTCDIEVFVDYGGYEGAETGGSSFGGGGGATSLSDTEVFPAEGDTAIVGGWLGVEVRAVPVMHALRPSTVLTWACDAG